MRKTFVMVAVSMLVVGARASTAQVARDGTPASVVEWPMHEIDNPDERLPNGLDVADVNRDGYPDFVTNYEGGEGHIRVAFHPGKGHSFSSLALAVRRPWPAVLASKFPNAENAAFGDLNGDGCPDIVVAHGNQEGQGERSGISIVWCANRSQTMREVGWHNAGDIPKTNDQGHYLYIKTLDVNGDGALDIIVGGRRDGSSAGRAIREGPKMTGALAGLKWIESPGHARAKNLASWAVHDIDPELFGGYGFRFGDLDGDGDQDIALSNKDWDTPEGEAKLLWYENPGTASPEQARPWPRHVVRDGDVFYTKTQVDIGDVDADGRNDLVIQSDEHVHFFRNTGTQPVTFEEILIPKPEITRFRTRPIRLADLNGNGKLDIVGMLIHHDGLLPADKAAVFWMEFSGTEPRADNWTTHVVKMGDGYDGGTVFTGEKWDQMAFYDVDQDGDLDIVSNVEEFHGKDPGEKVYLAVVWFENPLIGRSW